MRYQCYYNETIFYRDIAYIGKKILLPEAVFDTEDEAEEYCLHHIGAQKCGDEWIENEVMYERIE